MNIYPHKGVDDYGCISVAPSIMSLERFLIFITRWFSEPSCKTLHLTGVMMTALYQEIPVLPFVNAGGCIWTSKASHWECSLFIGTWSLITPLTYILRVHVASEVSGDGIHV